MALYHSILTATNGTKPPLILAGVLGGLLLIAFCIGFKKGARRISWTGLVWLVAGAVFMLLNKYLGTAFASNFTFVKADIRRYASTLVLAVGAVVGTLVLYGVCTLVFRPKTKRAKKMFDKYDEYDEDDDFDDDFDDEELVRKNKKTVSIAGRFLGGLLCMLNTGMILAVTVGTALLLLNGTGLKTHWAGLFGNAIIQKAIAYANRYALDLVLIGILVAFACKGKKKGFVETLRGLLTSWGMLGALVFAFYLPFKVTKTGIAPAGVQGTVFRLVYRCEVAVGTVGKMAQFAPLLSKILAGVLLAIVFVTAMVLVNWLLKLAVKGIGKVGVLKGIDGSIACAIYLVVGAVICVAIWALLTVLAYYEIFNIATFFTDGASLSNAFLKTCQSYINPILDVFKTKMA